MNARPFQFEWDKAKADSNARKHGITFELASTAFYDPRLLTVADLEHSEPRSGGFQSVLPATAHCCQWLTFGLMPTPPRSKSG